MMLSSDSGELMSFDLRDAIKLATDEWMTVFFA